MKNFLIAFSVFTCWCVVGLYFLNTTGASNRKSLFKAASVVEESIVNTPKRINTLELTDTLFKESEDASEKRGIYQDSSFAETGNYDALINNIQERLERNQRAIEEDEERLRLAKLNKKSKASKTSRPEADITFRPSFKLARLVHDQKAAEFLAQVERQLKINPQTQIEIIGHTDHIGDDRDNYKLALEQAQKIRQFVIKSFNLTENQVIASSKGESDPLYPREMEDKIELNNRYELIFK